MGNTHYPKLENTCDDLKGCLWAMHDEEPMSDTESRVACAMLRNICDFLIENFIIEDYNDAALKALVYNLATKEVGY